MPRKLSPSLARCLERANPNVATFVEVSVPDQSAVLHRAEDQFLSVPSTPANTLNASPAGALTLASTDELLISQFVEAGGFNIPQESGGPSYVNAVGWRLDKAFAGCIPRSVTVRLKWLKFNNTPDVKLAMFRVSQAAGTLTRNEGSSTVQSQQTQMVFTSLLKEPVLVTHQHLVDVGAFGYDGSGNPYRIGFADVVFDLTPLRLAIDPTSPTPLAPDQSGDLPEVFFSVQTTQQKAGNFVEWRYDTTSNRSIAGIGDVREVSWTRSNPSDPGSLWTRYEPGRALTFKLKVESYAPTSAAVYPLTLPALPDSASTGRIVFSVGAPRGTAASLELSTAGAGGPFAAVTNGDLVTSAQQTYHARLTLTASADARRAPFVTAFGVEFRATVDLSPESSVQHMSQEVALPFLAASIGEGSVDVVRAGRRDYRDLASELAVAGPDTLLEADIFLASRHPLVTRADWLRLSRAQVSNRQPTSTGERLSLLSLTKRLKRKVPARVESISRPHTVIGAPTPTQVQVTPALQGVSPTGDEYDGAGYYIRVRRSSQTGVETGLTFDVAGNAGVDKLDFSSTGLPGTFAVGDLIEVHSGQFVQPKLRWVNADPADVWWELLTLHALIPSDRIGLADVGTIGRGGMPPRLADRAPDDPDTQDRLRVTLEITTAEDCSALVDQLSFIMGGTTIEIAGQIVYRQIYPLRDALGNITVGPDPVAAVFDARDYTGLETPTGREQRTTVLACDYGVNAAAAAATPALTVQFVDVDTLAALGTQDLEGAGVSAVPSEIARWCFNTADEGRYLAEQLTRQVVLAGSTGLRAWPWTAIEAHPGLTVGDTVVVITDQYTDYDPARDRAIRGWNAYPLTLVATSDGGRRFRGFLQGLADVSAVQIRGGAGTLDGTNQASSRFALNNIRWEDTPVESPTQRTYYFDVGAGLDEVWAAFWRKSAPSQKEDLAVLRLRTGALDAGATSYTVELPQDGEVTLVQLEGRLADGTALSVENFEITGAPQSPTVFSDDSDPANPVTQYVEIVERGIPVLSVEFQVQIGTTVVTDFGPPTRGPGDASVVKGGTLAALCYEHDLTKDPSRMSSLVMRITLANGAPPITQVFDFDRDRAPQLLKVSATGGVIEAQGDVDTKSLTVASKTRLWSRTLDGAYGLFDVTNADLAGHAGLGVASPGTNSATGGTITDVGGYRYHRFTAGGTFALTAGTDPCDVLVVAGGGGGGGGGLASGGGAGRMVERTAWTIPAGSYAVVIGGGGAGGTAPSSLGQTNGGDGAAGGDSTFNGITAKGGGAGRHYSGTPGTAGGTGGSGGGGSAYSTATNGAGGAASDTNAGGGTSYGNAGGHGDGYSGGAGGGAGGVGGNGNNFDSPSTAGAGRVSVVDGNTYAAGGRGGYSALTLAAAPNSGNGGDCGGGAIAGEAGDAGVVVIRYPIGVAAAGYDTFTVTANSDPAAYLTSDTLHDSRDQVVANGSPSIAATLAEFAIDPPAIGSDDATIWLRATSAPVGWTVELWIGVSQFRTAPTLFNRTSSVSPALSAPPTALTTYAYPTAYAAAEQQEFTRPVTMRVQVYLKDATGAVVDTKQLSTTWYTYD